jgi:hypothetical protein
MVCHHAVDALGIDPQSWKVKRSLSPEADVASQSRHTLQGLTRSAHASRGGRPYGTRKC